MACVGSRSIQNVPQSLQQMACVGSGSIQTSNTVCSRWLVLGAGAYRQVSKTKFAADGLCWKWGHTDK
eukprot:1150542-Pelagomonas_calceolata.AAC.2